MMNELYDGVCYAGIDIEPDFNYPKVWKDGKSLTLQFSLPFLIEIHLKLGFSSSCFLESR